MQRHWMKITAKQSGLLFSLLPVTTFMLHYATLLDVPEVQGGGIVYFPLTFGLWAGNASSIAFGGMATIALWFCIGQITRWTMQKYCSKMPPALGVFLVLLTIFGSVLCAWALLFEEQRQILGIGYSLEDCKKLNSTESSRNRCISSVAIRMINAMDPAVNQDFCNDLVETDATMFYCWQMLAQHSGRSVEFCLDATSEAQELCITAVGKKQGDERFCRKMEKRDTQQFCLKRLQEIE